ncbi:MAG: hypothetical protein KDA37_03980 [Planctomycetales bacterium]|nr:hypothetical protein [Planctomycetales bacterium]
MAVPDWPSTYGFNMFAYPWQTWVYGPWDLFIEHGHRLVASTVGLVTMACVAVVYRSDKRVWVRRLSLAALALVIAQGVLGGVRVTEIDRTLAMVHGCTGPLFFALTALLWAVTSRTWFEVGATIRRGAGEWLLAAAVLAYLQLCLGAQLRHVAPATGMWAFAAIVKLHLAGAAVLAVVVTTAALRVLRQPAAPRGLRMLSAVLMVLLAVQIALGVGAWLLKYGAPGWAVGWLPVTMEATLADGMWQTHMATAHSSCGSLILAIATAAAAYSLRHTESTRVDSEPAAPVAGATA